MNPLKRLASDTAIYGLGTIVPRFINYLLVFYHTRILDRAQYGIFTELYGWLTFLLVLLTYGMETGFFRFSSRKDQNPNQVFSTALSSLFTTSLLFFVLVAANIGGVSSFIGYPDSPSYALQLAGVIAIDAFMSIPFARLRYLGKAKLFSALKLSNVVFYVLVSVVFLSFLPNYFAENPHSFLLRWFSPTPDVGYIFLANLLSSAFTLLLLLPTIFSIKFSFSWPLWRSMLIYSLPLLIAGLPGVANDYIDRIIFKHLYADPSFALDQLGVYGANTKLAMLMVIFVQMFRYAAEPFFFSQADKSNMRAVFADVMKYFVICAMFIFLFVTLYIDFFAYLTGKNFREGIDIVPIMLFANLLLGISFNLSMWYKLSEKTRYAVYITFSGMLVTVLVNVIFIPRYGYHAAAWAHFCSYAVMVIISYFLGQKFYPISYDLKSIGFYIAVGLGIYAIFALAGNLAPVLKFVVATLLLGAYFAVALWRDGKPILSRVGQLVRKNKS